MTQPPEDSPRNGLGIAALVLGVVGVLLGVIVIGIVPSILSVIFGAIGVRRVKRGVASNRRQAWAGLILGLIGFAFGVLVLVFLANRYQDCEHKGYDRGSAAFDHCVRGDSGY